MKHGGAKVCFTHVRLRRLQPPLSKRKQPLHGRCGLGKFRLSGPFLLLPLFLVGLSPDDFSVEADKPRSCGPHHCLWRIILRRRRLLSSTHAQASVLHACAAAEPLALPFAKCRTQHCCLAYVGRKKSRCFRYSVTSSGEVDLSFPHQNSWECSCYSTWIFCVWNVVSKGWSFVCVPSRC